MSDETPESDTPESNSENLGVAATDSDEGPGCLPGIMASVVLAGIFGFIAFGGCTWYLFTKRAELALRTLRNTYVPDLEQSLLSPDEKKSTIDAVEQFADDLERGKYENWQASAVMLRLVRLPVFQWGELSVVEAYIEKHPDEFEADAAFQFMRLRRAVQENQATTFDFEDVLSPVMIEDGDAHFGRVLIDPLTVELVTEVVNRAEIAADRAEIPDTISSDPTISEIVKDQIKAGINEGSM